MPFVGYSVLWRFQLSQQETAREPSVDYKVAKILRVHLSSYLGHSAGTRNNGKGLSTNLFSELRTGMSSAFVSEKCPATSKKIQSTMKKCAHTDSKNLDSQACE